jgi:hypothetical protein
MEDLINWILINKELLGKKTVCNRCKKPYVIKKINELNKQYICYCDYCRRSIQKEERVRTFTNTNKIIKPKKIKKEKCIEFFMEIRQELAEGFFHGRSFCSDYDFSLAFKTDGIKLIVHQNQIRLEGNMKFMVLFCHLRGIAKYEIKDEFDEYGFEKKFNNSYLEIKNYTMLSRLLKISDFLKGWTEVFYDYQILKDIKNGEYDSEIIAQNNN